jgi:hypothetical protein
VTVATVDASSALPDREAMIKQIMAHRLVAVERPIFDFLMHPYPESVLTALYSEMLVNKPYARAVADLIVKELPAYLVNEAFAFAPLIRKTLRYVNSVKIASTIGAIHHYKPHLPDMEDYSDAPDSVKDQITALIIVADILEHEFVSVNHSLDDRRLPIVVTRDQHAGLCFLIDGDDLTRYVIDHPDKAQQIAAIVVERYTGDVSIIESILHADAPALSNGNL